MAIEVIEPKTPRVVITCGVMKPELEYLRSGSKDVEVIYLEQNLHRTPHLMPERVQAKVDEVAPYASQIVLGYGLCSNGIVGIQAPEQGLVITKAHDCIAIFLGSLEAYYQRSRKTPGSYYLTPGWIYEDKDPLGIMEKEYIPRMGAEIAEWGIKEEIKNYSHIILINTQVADPAFLRDRAVKNAQFFDKKYEEVQGDLFYFKRILFGPYQSELFYFVAPGEKIQQSWFVNQVAML